MRDNKGVTLIEVILAIGIIMLLFGGIYTAYVSIIDAIANSETRTEAGFIASREVEIVRNIPYESVGTIGGFPPGILPQVKNVTSTASNNIFTVRATVRNIDDPFDGTLGGTPNDTAPADYKLVELEIGCSTCQRFVPLIMTTTVAPKNLEGALTGGSLFINVFDASGVPIQNATVHLVNASITPAINLTDITNVNGVLQLVGVPTSTERYAILVSKEGYSSEQTYFPGAPDNPNPVKPHATVAPQSVTQISFAIDSLASLGVKTSDNVCGVIGNSAFSIKGAKLIGTSPDLFKFSTSSVTDVSGEKYFSGIEWDAYSLSYVGSGYDLAGTIPMKPAIINPGVAETVRMILAPAALRSILVRVKNMSTGAGIEDAVVTISGGSGYSSEHHTGRSYLSDTDWSGGNYIGQSGGIDTESLPGSVKIMGPPFSTSTTHWLISRTFDLGGSSSTLYRLFWNPISQPAGAGAESVRFQIASNDDNATWNYLGPDGTGSSYYTNPNSLISSAHNNHRYFRYKIYLKTADENTGPSVQDVNIEFKGPCVPRHETYFAGMGEGIYEISAIAPGYSASVTSTYVGNGWQEVEIGLTP